MSIFQNFKYILLFFIIFSNLTKYSYSGSKNVCFVLSKTIRPYLEMLDGYYDCTSFNTKLFNLKEENISKEKLEGCDFIISVGTSANYRLSKLKAKQPKIYTFFIYKNEFEKFNADNLSSGIYLYPDPDFLIDFFQKNKITKIVSFFSEEKVKEYLKDSFVIFFKEGIKLDYFRIKKNSNFELLLTKNRGKVLWVLPDKYFSSQEFIEYIVNISALNNLKVLGFNRYFYKVGAKYFITIKYKKIGKIIAEIIKNKKTGIFNAPFELK